MYDLTPKKVLCVGMMTCDSYYYDVDPLLLSLPNGTNSRVLMAAGGDATNVSIDLARMGHDSALIGLIGNDFHGDGIMKTVTSAGVNTDSVIRRDDVTTTMTLILYTRDAQNASDRHCSRNEGGNAQLCRSDITDDMLRGAAHLHYGSFGPLKSLDGEGGADLLARAQELGLSTSLDVKGLGRNNELLETMLPHVDLFMPNIDEVEDLIGLTDLHEIRAHYEKLGVGTLCVKMAERGVYITDFNEEVLLPTLARQEEIVDVMGAGDAFCAGFISARLARMPMKLCGTFASLASKRALVTAGASAWNAPLESLAEEAQRILAE